MPTFGDTTAVNEDYFPCDADRALVDRFAISENGTADSLTIYWDPSQTTTGTSFKGLIYADTAGAPSTLVAVSASGSCVDGWVTVNFAGESLSTGNYWLGAVCNGGAAAYGADTTGDAPDACMANGTLSYASPGNWPGTDASYGLRMNVYVTYSTGGGATRFMGSTATKLVAASRASVF